MFRIFKYLNKNYVMRKIFETIMTHFADFFNITLFLLKHNCKKFKIDNFFN